jgi:hypothetical protein
MLGFLTQHPSSLMSRLARFWSRGSSGTAKSGSSPKSRDDAIVELAQALLDSKVLCDFRSDKHIKSNEADLSSEVFSLCLLSVGCMILVKVAYGEYRAFQDMKSHEGHDVQRSHSVTMGEFIKYRCGSDPIYSVGGATT